MPGIPYPAVSPLDTALARWEEEQAEAEKNRQEKLRQFATEYNYLESVGAGQYASAALGAKNIRTELKRAFPGIKFTVRSRLFAGGDSIDIKWTLGPTSDEVKAIIGKYQKGSFDGMADSYEYDRDNVFWRMFGGARHVDEDRQEGDGDLIVAAALCDAWKLPQPADGKSFWNIYPEHDRSGHSIATHARFIIFADSYPAGAVITGLEHLQKPRRTAGCNFGWESYFKATFTVPAPRSKKKQKPVTGFIDGEPQGMLFLSVP